MDTPKDYILSEKLLKLPELKNNECKEVFFYVKKYKEVKGAVQQIVSGSGSGN